MAMAGKAMRLRSASPMAFVCSESITRGYGTKISKIKLDIAAQCAIIVSEIE